MPPVTHPPDAQANRAVTSAPPLTVFAIPKAFRRNIGIIQNNAIRSWHALRPRPRIILLGDDEGTAEIAAELGLGHIPQVRRNEFGTPLLSSAFALAREAAPEGLMMFINSDIIMTSDLMRALEAVSLENALLVGRRTHLYVRYRIDFTDPDWESTMRRRAADMGVKGGYNAFDYFVYPQRLFPSVPSFAVGRGWWDHWLVAEARRAGAALIDATPSVLAIHQNHDFLSTEESVRNLALFGLPADAITIKLADRVLKDGRLMRHELAAFARFRRRLLRAVAKWAFLRSERLG